MRPQAGRHTHPPAGCLESQSVKTTALGGERGYESGKKGKGRTRPLLVATLRLVLAVLVPAASGADPAGARLRCARRSGAGTKRRRIWGAGTDRGHLVEWVAQHMRFVLRVTWRPEGCTGCVLLPRRWVVERPGAWLNQSRRLRKDYERLPKSSAVMMDLSMTRLMLRRLTAT